MREAANTALQSATARHFNCPLRRPMVMPHLPALPARTQPTWVGTESSRLADTLKEKVHHLMAPPTEPAAICRHG
jgi:hypothetical protein